MTRTATIVLVVLLCSLTLVEAASAQVERDTLRYPYGCDEDETLRPEGWEEGDLTPVRCTTSNFRFAHFDSRADFSHAHFDSRAYFSSADFDSLAFFQFAQFDSLADFSGAQFDRGAGFSSVQFNNRADFGGTHFASLVFFDRVQFDSLASFFGAHFDSLAYFSFAQFADRAYFLGAHFDSIADFSFAQFADRADFRLVQADTIVFDETLIAGTLQLGTRASLTYPVFDLTTAILRPTTQIELHSPVHITIQREKITHLTLASHFPNDLSWDAKKRIIDDLKTRSFPNDEAAHFELDYLLARSTMFQGYTEHWYDPLVYVFRAGYWATMGLGYRPFRIFIWAALMIVGFAFYYRRKMPRRIYAFVQGNDNKPAQASQTPQTAAEPPTWNIRTFQARSSCARGSPDASSTAARSSGARQPRHPLRSQPLDSLSLLQRHGVCQLPPQTEDSNLLRYERKEDHRHAVDAWLPGLPRLPHPLQIRLDPPAAKDPLRRLISFSLRYKTHMRPTGDERHQSAQESSPGRCSLRPLLQSHRVPRVVPPRSREPKHATTITPKP